MNKVNGDEKLNYDVLIIGAGPSGATAAHGLVKKGYRVLIIEKKKLPRYKICSGLITDRAQELLKQIYGELPKEIFCKPEFLKGSRFSLSEKNLMEAPSKNSNVYNIWRSDFDAWLK